MQEKIIPHGFVASNLITINSAHVVDNCHPTLLLKRSFALRRLLFSHGRLELTLFHNVKMATTSRHKEMMDIQY